MEFSIVQSTNTLPRPDQDQTKQFSPPTLYLDLIRTKQNYISKPGNVVPTCSIQIPNPFIIVVPQSNVLHFNSFVNSPKSKLVGPTNPRSLALAQSCLHRFVFVGFQTLFNVTIPAICNDKSSILVRGCLYCNSLQHQHQLEHAPMCIYS